MPGQSSLHSLIHALSPSEKRYFKLYAEMGTGRSQNNDLELFDCLNQMPEYEDQVVREKLAGKKFASHLPSTSHRLYTLILRSMRTMYEGQSVDGRLRSALAEMEFLLGKRQYREAGLLVVKAKGLARAYDREAALLHERDLGVAPEVLRAARVA